MSASFGQTLAGGEIKQIIESWLKKPLSQKFFTISKKIFLSFDH